MLAETQGAVLPLVPYLNALRWLFIAVALGGIAAAILPGSMIGTNAGGDGLIGGMIARACASRNRTALEPQSGAPEPSGSRRFEDPGPAQRKPHRL